MRHVATHRHPRCLAHCPLCSLGGPYRSDRCGLASELQISRNLRHDQVRHFYSYSFTHTYVEILYLHVHVSYIRVQLYLLFYSYDLFRASPLCLRIGGSNCSDSMAGNASITSVTNTLCPVGFYPPNCAACPGLRAVTRSGTPGYEGEVCSGHGTCRGGGGIGSTYDWNATKSGETKSPAGLNFGFCECTGTWQVNLCCDACPFVFLFGFSNQ